MNVSKSDLTTYQQSCLNEYLETWDSSSLIKEMDCIADALSRALSMNFPWAPFSPYDDLEFFLNRKEWFCSHLSEKEKDWIMNLNLKLRRLKAVFRQQDKAA